MLYFWHLLNVIKIPHLHSTITHVCSVYEMSFLLTISSQTKCSTQFFNNFSIYTWVNGEQVKQVGKSSVYLQRQKSHLVKLQCVFQWRAEVFCGGAVFLHIFSPSSAVNLNILCIGHVFYFCLVYFTQATKKQIVLLLEIHAPGILCVYCNAILK